jgi:hypothetical protein
MKRMALAFGAVIFSAGCAVDAPKVAAVPVAPEPKPDPPALIFPQTALELPDPQPVPPESIPRRDLPVQPPAATRTPPRRPAATTKREPEAIEPSLPQSESARPSTRTPLVSSDNSPKSDIIQKRLDSLKAMQPRLANKTGKDAELTRSRIQFFLDQAAKALARKDLRQADALASRAEVLAQDLLGVR